MCYLQKKRREDTAAAVTLAHGSLGGGLAAVPSRRQTSGDLKNEFLLVNGDKSEEHIFFNIKYRRAAVFKQHDH